MGMGLRSSMASAMASALVATFVGRANAQTQSMEPPMAPPPVTSCTYGTSCTRVLPIRLSTGNQQFDLSVAGLRNYLETTRTTEPQLFGQLAPDLDRLEASATTARVFFIAGLTLGAASLAYAVLGGKTCTSPTVDDPTFGKDIEAWSACNDDDLRMHAEFGLLGLGSLLAGGAAWLALSPSRADLLAFVNKHNRLSRQPLHFEVGYDPARHLSQSGVTLAF